MQQRRYFDCFGTIGKPTIPNPHFPYDEAVMIKDMEYARIHGAAVIHSGATDYSFTYGNKLCLDSISKNARLYPLSVVMPTAEFETGDKNYFKNLLDAGSVGFVISSPSVLKCVSESKGMAKMAQLLMEHGKPLVVLGVQSEDGLTLTDKLAREYPGLPVIMQGTHWGTNRSFFEVMDKRSNLYFDISQNHTNNIIEITKNNFGIHRVLYSSQWPYRSMGAIKSMVEYADITNSEKDLVACGNACNLFGISPDTLILYNDANCELDEIARQADEGLAISEYVIDPHSHIIGGEAVNRCIMPDSDYISVSKKMNRLGIDATITAPWVGINYDGIKGNEEICEAKEAMPQRFMGYSLCNVNYDDEFEKMLEYHEKYPDVFVGIKPYPVYQHFKLTDDVCSKWFEYANKHSLLALIHADSVEYAQQTDVLSEKYPNVNFILAHSGASYSIAKANAAVAKKHKNVVLDITYTSVARGMIEYLISEVGVQKVLFATDMPMREPSAQLGWVCYANISVDDKKKILGENILSLIQKKR